MASPSPQLPVFPCQTLVYAPPVSSIEPPSHKAPPAFQHRAHHPNDAYIPAFPSYAPTLSHRRDAAGEPKPGPPVPRAGPPPGRRPYARAGGVLDAAGPASRGQLGPPPRGRTRRCVRPRGAARHRLHAIPTALPPRRASPPARFPPPRAPPPRRRCARPRPPVLSPRGRACGGAGAGAAARGFGARRRLLSAAAGAGGIGRRRPGAAA